MFKKIVAGGCVLICILAGIFIYNKISYVGELVDPLTYFDEFKDNTNNLVYEDKRMNEHEPIQIIDGEIYVKYTVAHDYMSDRIFYDKEEHILTLTNPKEIVRLQEGENTIELGGIKGTYSIVTLGEALYLEASLLKDLFGIEIQKGEDERVYVATDGTQHHVQAVTRKKAQLRTHAARKSNVVEVLGKGEPVTIYSEENGFVRVRSENGIIGYLPTDEIKDKKEVEGENTEAVEPWEPNPLGETVKLMWDDMTTRTEKDWTEAKYARMENVNVIAPAWFQFADSDGTLSDIATASYVNQAHQKGLKVWAILRHNFSEPSLTAQILSSTKKRTYVIDQLIQYAKQYDLDGINIDIENIQEETSQVWVQFMRELYPRLRAEGLVVSVDVYTPSAWSYHYEREKVAESSDYFILMAYDQHWSGSEEAGSVAELPWTEESIVATLQEVPKEKLVLGIPFYTRLWKEGANGLETKAYSMNSMAELIDSWGVTPIHDEISGQNYITYPQDDGVYKVWLEDYESVAKRIALMEQYELAGYGAWRLGYETDDIWTILNKIE